MEPADGGFHAPLLSRQVIVLLHGAGATARFWRRQFGPLSERFHVIAPDLPGFGGTDLGPVDGPSAGGEGAARSCARFLRAFLDKLGIKNASLVGSSFGGWAACWYAALYPDGIGKLVLVSPAGAYLPDNPPISISKLGESLIKYYEEYAGGGDIPSGAKDELGRALATIRFMDESGALLPDVVEALPDIVADTLVVWGSDDRVVSADYAGIFHSRIRNSAVRFIEGAGHTPYAERPEEFNKIVMEFLT